MVDQGVITKEVARRTWLTPIQPTGWQVSYDENGNITKLERTDDSLDLSSSVSSALSEHVVLAVRDQLLDLFGRDVVFGEGGLRVVTTIDVQAEKAALAASRNAEIMPGAELALVGLDPASGEILAMVGGYLGNGVSQFNRVTQAYRQPGSSFKPIVYATAIEQGGYTQATVIADEPTVFKQPGQEAPWEPVNSHGGFTGFQTLRQHLDTSQNIPAIKLAEAVTIEAVVERATQLGYRNCPPYLPVALGACVATPLQHASAIGTFANGGVHVEPHLITRVEDADGNVLYQASPRKTRVWSEQTSYIMLDLMHGNVVDPVGYSNRADAGGRWVAGKTGTSGDADVERDIWFVGMTPGMVAAVWMGYDDNRALPSEIDNARESGLVTSSRQPIYVWNEFMQKALLGTPTNKTYPVPDGIVFENVDLKTGLPEPGGTRMAFVSGTQPSALGAQEGYHPISISIPVDKGTGLRATATTPRDQIEWVDVKPDEIGKYMPETPSLNPPGRPSGAFFPQRSGQPSSQTQPTVPSLLFPTEPNPSAPLQP
ncbi:MAG TPA: penicillin-binding transpeptidase domain-containing protein, partial [Trueperaceae bacterium]